MGFLKKNKKQYYKVYAKCSDSEHGKILLVSTKEEDFEKRVKNKEKELLIKIFGDKYCEKCIINVDLVGKDSSIKKIKKIYSYIEL